MKLKRGYIRDPIHGYITFDKKLEKPLIDHPLIQRLRYIRQLQLAHLVYPGATHTRFLHSVGVMHTAGRFAEKLFTRMDEELLSGFYREALVEASRILGLVHDVGHGPFSHAFDEAILSKHFRGNPSASNHEMLGKTIYGYYLKDELRKQFYGTRLEGAEEIVSQILNGREPEGVLRLVRYTVRDFYYPSDLLDFLMRDSYYTGTLEYGFIDNERLIESSYPLRLDSGKLKIALDRKADGALRSLIQAKVSMFECVYLHHSNRAYDRLLKKILAEKEEELGLVKAIENLLQGDDRDFLMLWDDAVFNRILSMDDRECPSIHYLKRRYSPWKLEYTPLRIPLIKAIPREKLEEYKKMMEQLIEEKIGERQGRIEEYWIEAAEINPVPTTVTSSHGHGNFYFSSGPEMEEVDEVRPEELAGLLGVIPTLHLRVYIRRDIYARMGRDRVRKTIMDASREIMGELDERYKIKELMAYPRNPVVREEENVTM